MSTTKRFFYVVYPPEGEVRTCLDAIRLVASPRTRHPAHITIRGPYEEPIDITELSERVRGKLVRVADVGTFFSQTQNTVFFHCSCPDFLTVWHKEQNEYLPHITLYDGNSKDFAYAVRDAVGRHAIRFTFKATGLEPLLSQEGNPHSLVRERYDPAALIGVVGRSLSLEEIDALDVAGRLDVIEHIARYLATAPRVAIPA